MSITGQSRWLGLILLVSLAGNLFFGGIVAARWFSRSDRTASAAPTVALRAVPREYRKVIDEAFDAKHDDIEPALEATKQARNAVRDALSAEPFNATALETAYTTMRERSMIVQEKYHQATVEAVAQLPPAIRKSMAGSRSDKSDRAGK